jgi:hypothetical protein
MEVTARGIFLRAIVVDGLSLRNGVTSPCRHCQIVRYNPCSLIYVVLLPFDFGVALTVDSAALRSLKLVLSWSKYILISGQNNPASTAQESTRREGSYHPPIRIQSERTKLNACVAVLDVLNILEYTARTFLYVWV